MLKEMTIATSVSAMHISTSHMQYTHAFTLMTSAIAEGMNEYAVVVFIYYTLLYAE